MRKLAIWVGITAVALPALAAPASPGGAQTNFVASSALAHPEPTGELADGWWLLVEDQRSSGLQAVIRVNGVVVQRFTSGGSPVLVPIHGHVVPGANRVQVEVISADGRGSIGVSLGSGVLRGAVPVFDAGFRAWNVGAGVAWQPIVDSFVVAP